MAFCLGPVLGRTVQRRMEGKKGLLTTLFRTYFQVRVALSELTLQQQQAKVMKWKLVIHGTKDPWSHIPSHMADKVKN